MFRGHLVWGEMFTGRLVGGRLVKASSRDILQQAKRDYLDRVHSDQMVIKMIRRGRLER
jgi:hypothetical protein